MAKTPRTASHTVAIPIVSMLLRFIADLLYQVWRRHVVLKNRRGIRQYVRSRIHWTKVLVEPWRQRGRTTRYEGLMDDCRREADGSTSAPMVCTQFLSTKAHSDDTVQTNVQLPTDPRFRPQDQMLSDEPPDAATCRECPFGRRECPIVGKLFPRAKHSASHDRERRDRVLCGVGNGAGRWRQRQLCAVERGGIRRRVRRVDEHHAAAGAHGWDRR